MSKHETCFNKKLNTTACYLLATSHPVQRMKKNQIQKDYILQVFYPSLLNEMVDSLKKFCSRILQDECFVKERSQNKTKNRAAIVIRDKLISRTWYMERDTWYNDLNDHLTQFLTDVKNDKHEWPRSDTTSYIQNQTSENFILNAPVQTQSKKITYVSCARTKGDVAGYDMHLMYKKIVTCVSRTKRKQKWRR